MNLFVFFVAFFYIKETTGLYTDHCFELILHFSFRMATNRKFIIQVDDQASIRIFNCKLIYTIFQVITFEHSKGF